MRHAYVLGIAALAACSTTTPASPAAAAGGLVVTIGEAPSNAPGCDTFSPDTANALTGQPVQWRNTTADTVSLQVAETVFLAVPPDEYSFPQTDLAGSFVYGPTSCTIGPDSSYASLNIVP